MRIPQVAFIIVVFFLASPSATLGAENTPIDLSPQSQMLFGKCKRILSDEEQGQILALEKDTRDKWLKKTCSTGYVNSCNPNLGEKRRETMTSLSVKYRWDFLKSICNSTYSVFEQCIPDLTEKLQSEFHTLPVEMRVKWINLYCKKHIPYRSARQQVALGNTSPPSIVRPPHIHSPPPIVRPPHIHTPVYSKSDRAKRNAYKLRIAAHVLAWPGLSLVVAGIVGGAITRTAENDINEATSELGAAHKIDHSVSNGWFITAGAGGALVLVGIICRGEWGNRRYPKRKTRRGMTGSRERYLAALPNGQGVRLSYKVKF